VTAGATISSAPNLLQPKVRTLASTCVKAEEQYQPRFGTLRVRAVGLSRGRHCGMRLGRRSPEAKVNETVYQPEATQRL
jgi:hypothetical protein